MRENIKEREKVKKGRKEVSGGGFKETGSNARLRHRFETKTFILSFSHILIFT